MKNIVSKIAVLIVLTFVNYSCSDDFVERTPVYSIDSENFFNSEDDYYTALIGAYDLLQSTYLNVILGEIASNNTLCGGESATDVIGWQQVDDMIHTPINNDIKNIWNFMYAGVNRSNFILEFQDKTDFNGKAVIIGETRFLRAYYYFELVKWFGSCAFKANTLPVG